MGRCAALGRDNGPEEHEASGKPRVTDERGTMDGRKLTNQDEYVIEKPGYASGLGEWSIAQPYPEPGPET
jgi:hypothetical protein